MAVWFGAPVARNRKKYCMGFLDSCNRTHTTFYRTQVALGSDLWVGAYVRQSVSPRGFADLTDVTLADEDSNSIPTDDVNRVIQENVAVQVAPSSGQH